MLRLRRILLVTCVASAACATAAHAADAKPDADGWYEGIAPDGSFRVRGPVPFEPFTQSPNSEAKSTTAGLRAAKRGAFDGKTQYIASCVRDPADARSADERIEASAADWKEQADFRYRRTVEAGAQRGTEFELSDPKKTLRVRVFAPPERTCTIIAQWNVWAKPREADVTRFLESFELRQR